MNHIGLLLMSMVLSLFFPVLTPVVLRMPNKPMLDHNIIAQKPKPINLMCLEPMGLKIYKGKCQGPSIPIKMVRKRSVFVYQGQCRVVAIELLKDWPPICQVTVNDMPIRPVKTSQRPPEVLVTYRPPYEIVLVCDLRTKNNKTIHLTFHLVKCLDNPMGLRNKLINISNTTIDYIMTDKGAFIRKLPKPTEKIIKIHGYVALCWFGKTASFCLINSSINGKKIDKPIIFHVDWSKMNNTSKFTLATGNIHVFKVEEIEHYPKYDVIIGKYLYSYSKVKVKPVNITNITKYCIQVTVKAYDPLTNSIKTYPNPCEVPEYDIKASKFKKIKIKEASCRLVNVSLYNILHKMKGPNYVVEPYREYYTPLLKLLLNCSVVFDNNTKARLNIIAYDSKTLEKVMNKIGYGDYVLLPDEKFYIKNFDVLWFEKRKIFLIDNWSLPENAFAKLNIERLQNGSCALTMVYLNLTRKILKVLPVECNKRSYAYKLVSIYDVDPTKINYDDIVMMLGPAFEVKNCTKLFLISTSLIIGAPVQYYVEPIYIPTNKKRSYLITYLTTFNILAYIKNNTTISNPESFRSKVFKFF